MLGFAFLVRSVICLVNYLKPNLDSKLFFYQIYPKMPLNVICFNGTLNRLSLISNIFKFLNFYKDNQEKIKQIYHFYAIIFIVDVSLIISWQKQA